jgi:hypothetical protein
LANFAKIISLSSIEIEFLINLNFDPYIIIPIIPIPKEVGRHCSLLIPLPCSRFAHDP